MSEWIIFALVFGGGCCVGALAVWYFVRNATMPPPW